jgi:hypothetical protein
MLKKDDSPRNARARPSENVLLSNYAQRNFTRPVPPHPASQPRANQPKIPQVGQNKRYNNLNFRTNTHNPTTNPLPNAYLQPNRNHPKKESITPKTIFHKTKPDYFKKRKEKDLLRKKITNNIDYESYYRLLEENHNRPSISDPRYHIFGF